jgi:Ca-activated chloride channel family protein
MTLHKRLTCHVMVLTVVLAVTPVVGQVVHHTDQPIAPNVIVPQSRAFAAHHRGPVEITDVRVGVVILDQVATTTMEIGLRNIGGQREQAELIVPVPDGAVVRELTFEGPGSEPTARVLPKDEARRTYDAIVAKIRDPALLEFIDYNLIRSSVFPIAPGGTQRIRLTYENLLPADANRVDYLLPRSESLDYNVPWTIAMKIKSSAGISTVYSPSHALETKYTGPNQVSVRVADEAATQPGPFRLSYLLQQEGVSASLMAYPDPRVGGGYFLLLAGLPAQAPSTHTPTIKRELTLVLDHSGSMRGAKIEQAREAALQTLAGLQPGEAFNLIVYSDTVDRFSRSPVIKTRQSMQAAGDFLEGITAHGGTNLHDALLEALRTEPAEGMLPIVLFLTDGLPTVGQTSEAAIGDLAVRSNPYGRRVFTFGVGVDVNTPLLERIAVESRAAATFVLPGEDVELKVAGVFKKLTGPVLADPQLAIVNQAGRPVFGRVRDVLPDRLPDLFAGDQLVVLGQYVGEQPVTFQIRGSYLGQQRTFRFTFGLDKATTRNAFVPRLWASRKIALLIQAVRQLGADPSEPGPTDPRLRELTDEIVRLSTEHGILTEYTAFLAHEGTDLSQHNEVLAEAERNFRRRAIATRSGLGAVNQEVNLGKQRLQQTQNPRNEYTDAQWNRVAVANVQQISDQALYRRGARWVDSRLIEQERTVHPTRVIEFGSAEFVELARRLAREGRQGCVSLQGEILLQIDGEPVLVRGPADETRTSQATGITPQRQKGTRP